MDLSEEETKFFDLTKDEAFISQEELSKFSYLVENNPLFFVGCLEENNFRNFSSTRVDTKNTYEPRSCISCNAVGVFKWGLLGKLKHPDCGASWYIRPSEYIGYRIGYVFKGATKMAQDVKKERSMIGKLTHQGLSKDREEKDTIEIIIEKTTGWLTGFIGGLIALIIAVPIHAILFFLQKKK